MTKRITITTDTFVPGESPEHEQEPVFAGTTLDTDDNTAGLLVAAGKAKYDKDAKLKSTAKDRMADIDARATAAAVDPAQAVAAAVAVAVAKAMAAQPAPAPSA
jgi:hypothetical protein